MVKSIPFCVSLGCKLFHIYPLTKKLNKVMVTTISKKLKDDKMAQTKKTKKAGTKVASAKTATPKAKTLKLSPWERLKQPQFMAAALFIVVFGGLGVYKLAFSDAALCVDGVFGRGNRGS